MPLHPRLAHMLLVGCDIHATETACLLAAVLSERNPLANQGVDITVTLAVLMGERRCTPELQGWFRRTWDQARRFARLASEIHKPRKFAIGVDPEQVVGVLLASAYPDRIARVRNGLPMAHYQLSNGRSARLPRATPWPGRTGWRSPNWVAMWVSRQIEFTVPLLWTRRTSAKYCRPWCAKKSRWSGITGGTVCRGAPPPGGQYSAVAEPLENVSEEARARALLGVVRKRGLEYCPGLKRCSSGVRESCCCSALKPGMAARAGQTCRMRRCWKLWSTGCSLPG